MINSIINNKYKIIEKIGTGSFGEIMKSQNIRTKEYVAIKIEPIINETKLLKNETIIYQHLNNTQGIPTIKWFGTDNINYYMVINLLGESLFSLKQRIGIFSLNLTLKIGIQIIQLLKIIHNKGLIHRDIKPDNFLFGLNENLNKLYIIDFGFCKSYLDTNNEHIKPKQISNLIGSLTYASINTHKYCELSRRDDLESLGYMLLHFLNDNLEWQRNHNINKDRVRELKENVLTHQNIHESIKEYIKYVRQLKFEETPDYDMIIDVFTSFIV